MSKLMLFVK